MAMNRPKNRMADPRSRWKTSTPMEMIHAMTRGAMSRDRGKVTGPTFLPASPSFQPAITDQAAIQPGDMVLFSSNGQPGGIHHVGLYLGNGQMLHAPESGDVVKVEPDIWSNSYYAGEFIGAVRATNPTAA